MSVASYGAEVAECWPGDRRAPAKRLVHTLMADCAYTSEPVKNKTAASEGHYVRVRISGVSAMRPLAMRPPDRPRKNILPWSGFGLALAAVAVSLLFGAAGAATSAPAHPAIPLIERAILEMRSAPETSRRDAQAALAVLAVRPDADLEIRARLILCDYQAERDTAAAEEQIAIASGLLPQAKRVGLRAGLLNCRGQIFETAGENAQARTQYEQAVEVATRTHDEEMLAESLFSRGYLRGLQGDYVAGLTDLKHAQALFDQLHKPTHSLTTLNSIAILYNRMGDYERARSIYLRALQAQHTAGMQREEAVTLHNLGRACENLHDWSAARRAFAESLALSRQLSYVRGEAYALRGIAAVENATGDPRAALTTLDQAQALQRKTPDARLRAQIGLARGIALHQLRLLPQSAASLEDALRVFLQADALGELRSTYAELAQVYADMGNWRAAYERQTQARDTSERLSNNQLDQRFAALKVEFDTATTEKENAALQRENRANQVALERGRSVRNLQATVIVLSVMLVLVLALVAAYQWRSTLRMRTLALTDELTGVPNRRSVLSRLDPLLREATELPCSVLIVDIDYFKRINDRYGHSVGDEVLKVVADTVRTTVAEPAFFGRLGGEEFLIVLPETDLAGGRAAAERLRERIARIETTKWFEDGRCITASIGFAVSTSGKDTPSAMLRRADAALYAAKRGGRNCVQSEPAEPQTDARTEAHTDAHTAPSQ